LSSWYTCITISPEKKPICRSYGFSLAIRYFGNLKELARRAKITRGKILYMRNHAIKVDLESALRIEIASEGAVKWYHFVEKIDKKLKSRIENGSPKKPINDDEVK
jgi:hypothetical protein